VTKAIALLCCLAGCGRLGFGVADDDVAGDARGDGNSDGPRIDADTGMPPTQVSPVVANATGDVILPFTNPTVAGSLLVVAIGTNATSNLALPAGWTIANQVSTNGGCTALIGFRPNNPGGLTSVTVTQISGVPTVALASEWNEITSTMPLDVIGSTSGNNPTAAQTVQTAQATTAAGELAVTSFCEDVNNPTYTGDPAWQTLGKATAASSSPSFIAEYTHAAAPGVVAATVTSSVSGKYAATIATFR
jgi:hypothetical protein